MNRGKMHINFDQPYPSTRSPVIGRNVVATSHPLASVAAAKICERRGNAIDTVLAAAISLTVLQPTGCGIGSDAFAILWDGHKLQGLNSSGRSPSAWTPEQFMGLDQMPQRGWGSVTTPGAIAAWAELFDPVRVHSQKGNFVTSGVRAGLDEGMAKISD